MTKSHRITHRCAGTPFEYWALELMIDGKVERVHTSKNYSYICRLSHGW